jgi:hypothetical protein
MVKSISVFGGIPGISSRNTSLNSFKMGNCEILICLFYSLLSITCIEYNLQPLRTHFFC